MPISPRLNNLLTVSLAVFTVAAGFAGPSCSHDSYLKVTLTWAQMPFDDVTSVQVDVNSNTRSETTTLTYDAPSARDSGTISLASPKTLSVAFTPSISGTVVLTVRVYSGSTNCIGSGSSDMVTIKKGGVTEVPITINHTSSCVSPSDGGTTVDGNVTFAGCDPAMPGACSSSQTCFVNCTTKMGECVAGGNKGPGESCTTNSDCMSGTQCFRYSCGVNVCLKFCAANNQCAPTGGSGGGGGSSGGAGGSGGGGGRGGAGGGAGGAGGRATGGSAGTTGMTTASIPPSACKDPVVCATSSTATVTTTYKTCTFGCDPRGGATNGCPAGLLCFLYRNPDGTDTPDCGCSESTRVGRDGAACTSGVDCAPGFICNMMAATTVCRKLCDLNTPTDCTAPRTCQTLMGNTFGVCL